MVADLIRKNHCYQLGDTGKDQVGMQGLLILGTASRPSGMFLRQSLHFLQVRTHGLYLSRKKPACLSRNHPRN